MACAKQSRPGFSCRKIVATLNGFFVYDYVSKGSQQAEIIQNFLIIKNSLNLKLELNILKHLLEKNTKKCQHPLATSFIVTLRNQKKKKILTDAELGKWIDERLSSSYFDASITLNILEQAKKIT